MTLSAEFVAGLREILGGRGVISDASDQAPYLSDARAVDGKFVRHRRPPVGYRRRSPRSSGGAGKPISPLSPAAAEPVLVGGTVATEGGGPQPRPDEGRSGCRPP